MFSSRLEEMEERASIEVTEFVRGARALPFSAPADALESEGTSSFRLTGSGTFAAR